MNNALSPLLLQAQITPPAGGGSFGLADPTRLENPFQGPMWLDEIRFRLPTADGKTGFAPWSRLSIELKLGELPLTRSFVPISLFGKVLNDSVVGGSQLENKPPGVFTWKLPKPLYIPARDFLRPTMYFEPYPGITTDQTVTIAYACRPIPKGTPPPRVLQLPWVSYFKPPEIAVGSTDQTDQSTPSDLYNPWVQDLHVQRFIGRLMVTRSDLPSQTFEDDGFMSLASANINLDTGLPITGTFVSAQDSLNNILVRDPTPFAHVFDFVDRSWTVNSVLPPKGFYLFTVDRLWSAYASPIPYTATVGIGMVGWREVQYVQGALR